MLETTWVGLVPATEGLGRADASTALSNSSSHGRLPTDFNAPLWLSLLAPLTLSGKLSIMSTLRPGESAPGAETISSPQFVVNPIPRGTGSAVWEA